MQSCKTDKYWSAPVATVSVSGVFYGDEIAAVGKVNITSCPTSSDRGVTPAEIDFQLPHLSRQVIVKW